MPIPALRTEFDNFFADMIQHTDLLVKIIKAKGIILSPDEEKEILPKLLPAEKRQIHEAFVLRICATWEILAENVFIECLLHDTSKYKDRTGITLPRKKLTRDICKGLVSGLGYFSFGDAGKLKGEAKKYLAERCNPFKEISSDITTKINEFYLIRNYIAHRSNAAKQSLKRMYKQPYRMRFRPPGNFLFDMVKFTEAGEKGEQIRFANYSEAFEKAADEMAEFICPTP
jgi:hypothetical protein